MNFTRAFAYIFEDRDWLAKLIVTFTVTAGAILLTPVVIGVALWAALLGYLVELVRNVRADIPQPLPHWDHFSAKMRRGFPVLGALVVYGIPNAVLVGCLLTLAPSLSTNITGTGVTLGIACCVFPLLLVYNLVALPVLALGIARYADDPRFGVFLQVGSLFSLLQEHTDALIQYVFSTLLASLALGLFALIPCIGWVALPALVVPVHGALMGQFAGRVLGKPKVKNKREPPMQPYRR